MNKKENINKIELAIKQLPNHLKQELKFDYDYKLNNGKTADLVLINNQNNELHSLWKIEDKIDLNKNHLSQSNPFLECGLKSDFWVHSDSQTYILNDLGYNYPGDQQFNSISDLFQKMLSSKQKREA